MSLLSVAALTLAGVNTALALVLALTYWRNHRQVRSPLTRALFLFAVFLIVHGAVTLYHGLTMMATYTRQAEAFNLAEMVLELGALTMLLWASMR